MSSSLDQIDKVFRYIDREIWIVTAAGTTRRGGLTATWVSQASIDADRPMAMIGLAPNHYTAELVNESGAFALHLLKVEQTDIAWNFANGSGRDRDKFTDLETRPGTTGSPLIAPCLAWLECRVITRLATGDRTYYWADVVAGQCSSQTDNECDGPLTEQQFFAAIPSDQRDALKASRLRDISVQRPLLEQWRDNLTDVQP